MEDFQYDQSMIWTNAPLQKKTLWLLSDCDGWNFSSRKTGWKLLALLDRGAEGERQFRRTTADCDDCDGDNDDNGDDDGSGDNSDNGDDDGSGGSGQSIVRSAHESTSLKKLQLGSVQNNLILNELVLVRLPFIFRCCDSTSCFRLNIQSNESC